MPNAKAVYHTRILKGGALLNDMRLLVRSWNHEMIAVDRSHAARNLLGKKTAARSRDTLTRAFLPRFLQGNPPNAWELIRSFEDRNAAPEILRPLYYWVTARNDRLLYDFTTRELIHIARSGDGSVRIEETVSWICSRLKQAGQDWTSAVALRVGQGMLAALRDFGILEGATRKRIAPVHLPIESFCYIAFCLNKLGFGSEALVNHLDWRLYLLTPNLIERLLLDAHQRNFLSFHSAGRIYRIDFPSADHESYADVLIGKRS